MFNRLFSKKHKKLNKAEYWDKWELYDLLNDLHSAEKFLANRTDGRSADFNSVKEFRESLLDEIDWIEYNNKTDLTQIYQWFLPTGVWDDFAGSEGKELGNKILERASKWKKEQH